MKKIAERTSVISVAALLLIAVFAVTLTGALTFIGINDGEVYVSNRLPEGLVSAGAPRSQLALKQMFDSMSAVHTNGNRVIYEPITEEYLESVRERIAKGEIPALSVEEVLYIISDTASMPEKYDGVKLHGIGTVTLRKNEETRPTHISALEQSSALLSIIVYRIKSLCAPEAYEADGDTFRYYPDLPRKKTDERAFIFTNVSDDTNISNIVFNPGDGQSISLYPSNELADLCNTKYMSLSNKELSEDERRILRSSGYDPDHCRNITPDYWYGATDCRIAVIGGRVLVIDPLSGSVSDSAPVGMRTVSHALCDADGDGVRELYFTCYADGRAAATAYAPGESDTAVMFETDRRIGAFEAFAGEGVLFYYVEQSESGTYLNLLHRVGSAIEAYN